MNQAATSGPMHVHVGAPPKNFQGWEYTDVHFHNFEELPSESGDETSSSETSSSEFTCFGNKWQIDIHPRMIWNNGGDRVGIFLMNKSDERTSISYGLVVSDDEGDVQLWNHFDQHDFDRAGSESGDVRTGHIGLRRSLVLDNLIQGTLSLRVQMKLSDPGRVPPVTYVPENHFNKNVLKSFMDKKTSDITFEVSKADDADNSRQEGKGVAKRAKKSRTVYAHQFILQCASNELKDMVNNQDSDVPVIQITDVEPEIFHEMIHYLYGGNIHEYLETNAQRFIDAADKYGVVDLKLEAEAAYVKDTSLSVDNILDNLLYADSKNLALLKEAVMDFIVKNNQNIIGKVSFDNVPGSTVTDILTAMSRTDTANADESDNNDTVNYNKMRVGTLRIMLDEKGLDVDGSRETMIAILEKNAWIVYQSFN